MISQQAKEFRFVAIKASTSGATAGGSILTIIKVTSRLRSAFVMSNIFIKYGAFSGVGLKYRL